MKTRILAVCFVTFAAAVTEVNAANCINNPDGEVVCGKGPCATDQYGKVFCASEGGGAMRAINTAMSNAAWVPAPKTISARSWCSAKPGGGAATNSNGKVKVPWPVPKRRRATL